MDPNQPRRGLAAHRVGHRGADIAALGDIAAIAEATHQLRPRPRDPAGIPANLGRLPRSHSPATTEHHIKRIRSGSAMGGRSVSGPTVRTSSTTDPASRAYHQRQRTLVGERTWTKSISTPSMVVLDCGSAFSLASSLRRS